MRRKSGTRGSSSGKLTRTIKRKTHRHYGAEEKIRIVLDGLRGEMGIDELCRREVRGLKECVADLTLEKRQPSTTKQGAVSFLKTFSCGLKPSLVTRQRVIQSISTLNFPQYGQVKPD